MKKVFCLIFAGLFVALCATSALAASPEEEVKAMVDKAVAFIKANGKDKAFAEINKTDGQFVKGDIYVNVTDLKGSMLANGANAKLIGTEGIGLKDPDGKYFVKEIVQRAGSEGKGWIEYKWPNPKTKKVAPKITYFEKVNDMIVFAGTYKK
jgi:cytochrome c